MANTKRKQIDVPLNRVEGDLEIRVELDGDQVSDSWSAGVMYRGIENMLKGRGALDGLVITPRICGICGAAHLNAAAKALDVVAQIAPPPNAVIVRNLALMTEHVQSDVRHGILMFMVDFANPAHQACSLYEDAVKRYEPFKGESIIETIKETKKVLEIFAILGGQWPHSSFMVPGGVASTVGLGDIAQCGYLLEGYAKWYERRILGCSMERWLEVQCAEDLDRWLSENAAHRDSELGFYLRFAREIGLDKYGRGHGNFVCFGQLEIPEGSQVQGRNGAAGHLIPPGFARGTELGSFSQELVTEHVAHSWYVDYEGGKHPFEGVTEPFASGNEGKKYSWAKAPRYNDLPAETGPLAEMVISQNPLFVDLLAQNGPNIFIRELARLVRPVELMPAMKQWFAELAPDDPYYSSVKEMPDGKGFGSTEAARGALGHWIEIANGKIERYQIITPTAWNGSPRDAQGVRGPWEEALIGTTVKDPENPVELGHVIRSFDACLVCTVHGIRGSSRLFRKRI